MSKRSPNANAPKNEKEVKIEDFPQLVELRKTQTAIDFVIEKEAINKLQSYYEKRRPIVKAIPDFWSKVFKTLSETSLQLQHQQDLEALSYLEDFWVVRDKEEPRCFTLEFHFKPNPFFSDSVLKKEYKYLPPQVEDGDKIVAEGVTEKALAFDFDRHTAPQSIKIQWKDETKNLTKLYPRVTDEEDEDDMADPGSFFNFFEHADDPFNLGVQLLTEVFPDVIEFFTGEIVMDMDSDDEDDDDEEEEEIDLEKPRKKQKTG